MTDTPTPADRGRDLRRDLATCEGTREGVSPGPWRESRIAAHDSEGEFCGHDLYVLDAAGEEIGGMRGDDDNAFVAEAREGWPVAIRRALAAEARVAELEAELAECRRVCESLAARCAAQSDLLSRRAERGWNMTESAFLRDIWEHPSDDVTRLVFADWLEDNGQPERAEFIRLQIAAHNEPLKTGMAYRRWGDMVDRYTALLARHQFAWRDDPRRGLPWLNWSIEFRRGFVHSVTLPLADFLRHGKALFSAHPIEEVRLSDRQPKQTSKSWERYHPPLWGWSPERPTWDDISARLPDSLFLLLKGFRTDLDHAWYSSVWRFYDTREAAHAALSRACVTWGRQQAGLPSLEA